MHPSAATRTALGAPASRFIVDGSRFLSSNVPNGYPMIGVRWRQRPWFLAPSAMRALAVMTS